MTCTMRWAPCAGLCVFGILGLWVVPALASHEAFGVYEDWRTARTIRSDRWTAFEGGNAQEVRLETSGHKLLMRSRREGLTTSNAGFVAAVPGLSTRNPAAIDQMEVDFLVRSVALSGCAANPGRTRVRPVLLQMSAFNDATGVDRTGDHSILVQIDRDADSPDPAGVLTVQAFVVRCRDSACSIGDPTVVNPAVGTVVVEVPFTVRAIWDRLNGRFLIGVNDNPDVVLTYDAAELDKGDARVPFANVRTAVLTANCTAGPTVADVEVEMREVRTNVSAIIP